MRILQVVTYYPPHLGGIENSVYNLVKRLEAKGHEVQVVTTADPSSSKYEIDVYRLPILFKFRASWGEIPFCPSILRALREFRVDIIHTHMPTRLFADLVTLSELTKTEKTPLILHYRLYQDFISPFARIISKLHYSTLGYLVFRHANRIVVPNIFYRELLEERFRIPPEKTCVVPNAVDDDVYDPSKIEIEKTRKNYGAEGKLVILFAGRLVDHKGIEYLIRAFRQVALEFRDTLLFIVGNGPLEASLRSLVNRLELNQHVKFLGAVPQVSMPELLSVADIFVLPSLFECSSNVLREALAMEKPVIATTVGDAPQVITHGKNGILVGPGEVEALTDTMRYLLANKKIATQLGRAGRKTIQERFSWDVAVQKMLDVYFQVLSKKQ